MKFQSSQVIPFPVDQVFTLVRDRLTELVPYMPNVERIQAESREDLGGGRVRIVNTWYGKAEIPAVVKKIIKPEMIAWLDTAVWDEQEKTCQWQIEPKFFQENIQCGGVNHYRADGGDRVTLEITGDLSVRTKGIAGVPRLLEKKVSGQVEKFVVKLLTPNLDRLAEGVTQYFRAQS